MEGETHEQSRKNDKRQTAIHAHDWRTGVVPEGIRMRTPRNQAHGSGYRISIFLYGLIAYAAFGAIFLYAVGFIGNFAVPKSLDSEPTTPFGTALLTDLGLLSVFALQHSIMARRGFKRMITSVIPASAERSTYVLASCFALALLFWKWQPLGGEIWHAESTAGRIAFYSAFTFGWALVFVSTIVINHFDLFGMRQVWRELTGQPQAGLKFTAPLLYRIVRHPLYVGWLFTFWSTPDMTASHLFFALVTSAYILVAIQFEEADLIQEHPEYVVYRKQVPMLIPRLVRDVSLIQPAKDSRPSAAKSYAP
jgi:protein-S-isoprenylcysteine O-methyltransferase Ste14